MIGPQPENTPSKSFSYHDFSPAAGFACGPSGKDPARSAETSRSFCFTFSAIERGAGARGVGESDFAFDDAPEFSPEVFAGGVDPFFFALLRKPTSHALHRQPTLWLPHLKEARSVDGSPCALACAGAAFASAAGVAVTGSAEGGVGVSMRAIVRCPRWGGSGQRWPKVARAER